MTMKKTDSFRFWRFLALAALFFLVAGCQQALYSGLREEEANLMLATLLENGIAAEKISLGKNGYALSAPKEEVVRSLQILKSKGFPRESFRNKGDVFSGQGMISSPTEEQARLAFAISQELAETFSKIDGVLTARAHVVLGHHDATSGTTTPASAAVFLRHDPDSPAVDLQGKIKETCVQSVPGLSYEKVSVMLLPVREEVVLPTAPADETKKIGLYGLLGAAGLLVVLGVLFFIARLRKARAARQDSTRIAPS